MLNRRHCMHSLAAASAWLASPATLFAVDEETVEQLWMVVRQRMRSRSWGEAEEALGKLLQQDDSQADAFYLRGRVRFRRSRFAESLSDFDRFVKLRPQFASRQWERGIACYYAGRFQAGADQFKLYQTFHDNDVENSVWRFLCMAPEVGVAKARAEMLPIENDRRIPMMMIYELFRGEATPWDVEAAIVSDGPSKDQLAFRRFYAQLYLGLYYEAIGNSKLGRKFILKAADDHRNNEGVNNYMWAVADVHAKLLRAGKSVVPKRRRLSK